MLVKISEEQKNELLLHRIGEYEFGTVNGNDKDLLVIIKPNVEMDAAFNNKHMFFYKDVQNKIDYIFATPSMVIKAILDGSNDLIYHMIFSKKFNGGVLGFINNIAIGSLYSRKMYKSLLGCAKRDEKQCKKLSGYELEKKSAWVHTYKVYCNIMSSYCIKDHKRTVIIEKLSQNTNKIRSSVDASALNILFNKLEEYQRCTKYLQLDWVKFSLYDEWENLL